ncbi:unnamed protein product, partial [Soboliphyme baturini]|uniref:C2 domain-containing protein n=1 Tax=Soboliphyme baturini TaxID=241478 RepID=A0A183J8U7_9BILA
HTYIHTYIHTCILSKEPRSTATCHDFGELLLYLSLNKDEEKLLITVAKAYNLRPMDITGASDPYVKIIQLNGIKRIRSKKTSIKRANLHPVYYEHLTLDIPKASINSTNLLIKVMDWDRIGRDDLLGCCIIGKDSPTEDGREQWRRCIEQETKASIGMWHSLLSDVPKEFTVHCHTAAKK